MTSVTERLIEAATQCLDKESDCQGECASVFPETCWWRNLKEAIAALEQEQAVLPERPPVYTMTSAFLLKKPYYLASDVDPIFEKLGLWREE